MIKAGNYYFYPEQSIILLVDSIGTIKSTSNVSSTIVFPKYDNPAQFNFHSNSILATKYLQYLGTTPDEVHQFIESNPEYFI